MLPKTKLQFAFTAMLSLVAFGTVGFKLLLGMRWFDCFYFTLITVTTIGYSEPPEMTEAARYFTSLLIIMGVGTIGYALTAPTQAVVESELVTTLGKKRMFK